MSVIFGDNQRINCGNDGSLELTGYFTVAIYAKPDAGAVNKGVFSRIQFAGAFPGYALAIGTYGADLKMQAYIGGWRVGGVAITKGVWSWFFYTTWWDMEAGNWILSFYQDLASKGSAVSVAPGACVEPANIGGWGDDSFDMDGPIGEAYVWNGTILTLPEMTLIVNSKMKGIGLQIQPAQIKGYWSLDDHPDGLVLVNDVFTDKSGTGNHGTTNGGTMEAEKNLSYQ